MTVAELIALLRKCPKTAEVMFPFHGGAPNSLEKVQVTKFIREHGDLVDLRDDLKPDQQVVVLYGHPDGEPGYDDACT
jgi:hypothetical protein